MTSAADLRIPADLTEPDISGVVVQECGEELAEISGERRIHVAPAYSMRGVAAASSDVKVRSGVLDALRRASTSLPDGIDLLVWDGLRSLEIQLELIDRFRSALPEERRDDTVERYLALPPACEAAFLESPPPHATGGAVDVTLCDRSGRALDLGAEFDQFDETAWLAYYERDVERARDPAGAAQIRKRRRLLYWAMLGAGFAPWPFEYWHYELGTTLAAGYRGRSVARYGAAVPWTASAS